MASDNSLTPLCKIAYKHGTDKCPQIRHVYTPFYYSMFKDKRDKIRKVLEIGIGGRSGMEHVAHIKGTYTPGASLYMWRDFFPNAHVYGADLLPSLMFKGERITTLVCDETKGQDLVNLIKQTGSDIDLVIDDASHSKEDQIFLCQTLMPLLNKDVTYVIEDVGWSKTITSKLQERYACSTPTLPGRKEWKGKLVVVKHKNGTATPLPTPKTDRQDKTTQDLTIIYLTASLIPERFAAYQRKILIDAIAGAPVISVSRKPLDFGTNILDNGPKCTDNIYRQMLRAAKLATTPYIAIAEDDTLYCPEHFTFYRPNMDTFAYNQNRLALFMWGGAMYNWRNRRSNASLIAPRKLMIEALEERFAKWPNTIPDKIVGELGRERVDRNMGVIVRKSIEVFSETPIIQFNHNMASERAQRRHTKRPGPLKSYDIPYWGKAKDLKAKFV